MAKGLRYYVAMEKRKRFLSNAGITQHDYFIASFPKSGNTWLRYLLANALSPDSEISPSSLSKLMPSIYDDNFVLENSTSPRYIKTHETFFPLYPKTIYICRDYRDIVVSSYFYLKNKNLIRNSISDFIHGDQINAFGPWEWHVQMALDWKEKHPDKILFIKYEDLLANSENELEKILSFCHIDSKKNSKAILDAASFSNLRKKEEITSATKDEHFFRKGISGDWKNHLSKEDLNYLLQGEKTKQLFLKLGYTV